MTKTLPLSRTAVLFFSVFALVGCSFVDTVPGSESVVVSFDTDQCKRLGETKVKVLSEIAGIDRDPETMAEELSILARNAAFEKGANVITPLSEAVQGTQTFSLFRCN